MKIHLYPSKEDMGAAAAAYGAARIREALARQGSASLIVATGASQFEMLAALVSARSIDWGRITIFHLDEYIGLPLTHPASFRHYLRERFIRRLPTPPAAFHEIDGEGDPVGECARLGRLIGAHTLDMAFIGIGENGHLAFNDPPADVDTEQPYLRVTLDDACRRQQLGEGWFATLDDVPTQAITMSVRQILKSLEIVCTVPDARKAMAVRQAVEGPVSPQLPASFLQTHPQTSLFLDEPAAAQLRATRRPPRT